MNLVNMEQKLAQISEDHPVWFWVLTRLTICVTFMMAFGFCLVACAGTVAALVCGYWGIFAICVILIPILGTCAFVAGGWWLVVCSFISLERMYADENTMR